MTQKKKKKTQKTQTKTILRCGLDSRLRLCIFFFSAYEQ